MTATMNKAEDIITSAITGKPLLRLIREDGPRGFYVRAYRPKATNHYAYYSFRVIEGREKWIADQIESARSSEASKLKWAEERKASLAEQKTRRCELNPTGAAWHIRHELKRAFPKTKFSVRTSYYSMGNSIDISWQLGPTTAQVEAIAGKYQQGSFDGMTDSYEYNETTMINRDGEVKRLGGAKYVHENRGYTQEQFQRMCANLCELAGKAWTGNMHEKWNDDPHSHEDIRDVVYQIFAQSDLTAGYHGVRHKTDTTSGGRWSDFYEMY